MDEVIEMKTNHVIQKPTSNTQSPALSDFVPKTPKSPFLSRVMSSPLASPMKKAYTSMRNYMEDLGHLTKLDPQDAWLPITESRNGNAYYAAFHTLSSGIGVQALLLPIAFTVLGWTYGIISFIVIFVWQLYTLWLLIQLHEFGGRRYSRYLRLSMAAFGDRLGKLLTLVPTMYLSGGTCVTLIMIGGATMKIVYHTIICGTKCDSNPLTIVEWYIVFTCSAIVLAQLPNLNSIAGVSMIGAVTAITYCTLIWVASVVKGRLDDFSYETTLETMNSRIVTKFCDAFNAIGIIAFAFRGHNLVLEIQGTMPSSLKHPSHQPMWKGTKFAYFVIAMCLFPLAIGGYWAYGNLIPKNGGILSALDVYHGLSTSKVILGSASLLVVINSLTSFQLYAMPVFDNLELRYTSRMNKPCPWWLRTAIRLFFGCLAFFIAVAFPFLPSLAGLIGGISLPVTLAYPCLMWIVIRKPQKQTGMWYLNWLLGILGVVLSILLVFGAIWNIVTRGIEVHFFKPE
ncbi:hypothetical protein Leryth_017609 [Lithospermum erythrorhizon]|uniref:Amino acid transporter transmembrane domain-containing protein n=1 Tax=Lithospermum erythrorhizon TaxID=34254 RepID=A0AAV3RF47_LITER|nr:hypothetical protein Leryth_017609 [Lithospermum erythrorhizon]